MKYYVIAGEASGDLHGSNLVKQLKLQDRDASIRCWGGDLMQKEGAILAKHYRDTAFMGFVEVIKNLRTIQGLFSFCHKDILDFQPDVIVLIDYPGFNLRIAKWAREHHFRVFYYISPQLWAWHSSRVKQVKQFVERMFVILPFEKAFYQKYAYEVDYVGHPLLDVTSTFSPSSNFRQHNQLDERPIIALLPGSRRQEIKSVLPNMVAMIARFPSYQFVIAGAPSQIPDFYAAVLQGQAVKVVYGQTYDLLGHADAALVTSGTATLETALFKVPQVVCYKGSNISYQIAKRVIKVRYISLVNLIADKLIVKELIQTEYTTTNVEQALAALLVEENRQRMRRDYEDLIALLGNSGASQRTAKLMIDYLSKPNSKSA
jgi:lipid-A-disaccharide synthase